MFTVTVWLASPGAKVTVPPVNVLPWKSEAVAGFVPAGPGHGEEGGVSPGVTFRRLVRAVDEYRRRGRAGGVEPRVDAVAIAVGAGPRGQEAVVAEIVGDVGGALVTCGGGVQEDGRID